jgi:hypothetical protein
MARTWGEAAMTVPLEEARDGVDDGHTEVGVAVGDGGDRLLGPRAEQPELEAGREEPPHRRAEQV